MRALPHDLAAEQTVLGAVLLSRRVLPLLLDRIAVDDFYHPAHAAIWSAMVELADRKQPVDVLTVADRMRQDDTLDRLRGVNGEAYFAELTSQVVTVENVDHHATHVRGLATRRRLAEGAIALASAAAAEGADLEDVVRQSQELASAAVSRSARSRLVTQAESVRAAYQAIQAASEARQAGKRGPWVPAPLRAVGRHLAGGWRAEYHVFAARPSKGKTVLVAEAVEAAAASGSPCLFFSREMAHQALSTRRIGARALVSGDALRSGDLADEDWRAITRASSELAELPIWYEDAASDAIDICAIARRWVAEHPCGPDDPLPVIAIDYLQLVRARAVRKQANPDEVITYLSAALKDLQKETGAVLLAACQLNRETEREKRRPRMADLRGSGSIEQDADVIVFIHHPSDVDAKAPEDRVELIFGKNRNGRVGLVEVGWDADHTRFFDAPESSQPSTGAAHWAQREEE